MYFKKKKERKKRDTASILNYTPLNKYIKTAFTLATAIITEWSGLTMVLLTAFTVA